MSLTFTVILIVMGVSAAPARVAPSRAWTVDETLGMVTPSTIDTLFENYHRRFVPSLQSLAWATTGNYGAQGQDQIFFSRPLTSDFFMADGLSYRHGDAGSHRYYNTRIPMTLAAYSTGGNKYSNQDRTTVTFSGNATPQLQFGAGLDYVYSKGSYDYQADKDFAFHFASSYRGDRYQMHALVKHYNFLTKESGGITDDRYITDPAAVQGGQTRVDNKTIPTQLNGAHTRLNSLQVHLNQRYSVGHYRYERDSVTDTVKSRTYIPVTSFIWTLDFKTNRHRFINSNGTQDASFFPATYLETDGTDESTERWHLRNTVGVQLLEGFNRYAKFGFAVYAQHEMRRFTQVVDTVSGTELPDGLTELPVSDVPHRHTQQLLWVGGRLSKQHGSILTYDATAQFGVVGDVAGDIDVTGGVATRFKLLGDSVTIRAYGYFKNLAAPYLLKRFVSNHYAWSHDWSKTQRLRVGGRLQVPHTGTWVDVGYETLKNYLYFNDEGVPAQQSDAVHVFSATLGQRLKLSILHWDNQLTYQTTSNDAVLSLPALSLYSNLYIQFKIARVLHVQLGLDCNYYTRYYAPAYNVATATFHTQHNEKLGNFIWADVYANFKLKRARFFVQYTHVNKGLVGRNNYFSVPHYPLNPGRFSIGVSVDFVN